MIMMEESASIAAMLGCGGFVRRNTEDCSLWISDAPRRLEKAQLISAMAALEGEGYTVWRTSRQMLAIDWNEVRWQAWVDETTTVVDVPFPQDDCIFPVFALTRLLKAHPYAWHAQPKTLIRCLLKNMQNRNQLITCAKAIHQQCAVRLRRGDALPSAVAGVLTQWLLAYAKEETR